MVVALGFDGFDRFARVVNVIYSVIAVYSLQRIGIRLLVQPGIEKSDGSAVHVDFHAPKIERTDFIGEGIFAGDGVDSENNEKNVGNQYSVIGCILRNTKRERSFKNFSPFFAYRILFVTFVNIKNNLKL